MRWATGRRAGGRWPRSRHFHATLGAPGNSPEEHVPCTEGRAGRGPRPVARVGARGGGRAPRPSAPPGPRPRGGGRAGARGVGRGAGGAGTCSPRAAASPGRPGRGPGPELQLPPGSAAQRRSPARLRRVYYAAGAGEPKRSRPRGPGGDGRRSRRGQVRLSLASLRARGGRRRRAGRAGQRGPESPAQAAGASGGAGRPSLCRRRLCARPRCNKARRAARAPSPRPPPAPSLPAGRVPGSGASPRPGLGGRRRGRGARSLELARPALAGLPCAQPHGRDFFPPFLRPPSFGGEIGEDAAGKVRGASRATPCAPAPLFLCAPRPPRCPAAAVRPALGRSTRPGRGQARTRLRAAAGSERPAGGVAAGQRPPGVRCPAPPSLSAFAGSQQPGPETQFPF